MRCRTSTGWPTRDCGTRTTTPSRVLAHPGLPAHGRNHHTVGVARHHRARDGVPRLPRHGRPRQASSPTSSATPGTTRSRSASGTSARPAETSAGPVPNVAARPGLRALLRVPGGRHHQWFPDLMQDNHPSRRRRAPDGYHLNTNLADRAIEIVKDAHVAAPDKPFFLWYAPGAGHAPHQAEPEWIEPYGVVRPGVGRVPPQGVRPPGGPRRPAPPHRAVRPRSRRPAWDGLDADAKRMFARQMEVYAVSSPRPTTTSGACSTSSTAWASSTTRSSWWCPTTAPAPRAVPRAPSTSGCSSTSSPKRLEDNLQVFDGWGGDDTFAHYSWGWTWAGTRRSDAGSARLTGAGYRALHRVVAGGHRATAGRCATSTPTPSTSSPRCSTRGIALPDSSPAAEQPVHGTSLGGHVRRPVAPEPHTTQYFEMSATARSTTTGGRRCARTPVPAWPRRRARGPDFRFTELSRRSSTVDRNEWELYDLRSDPAERRPRGDRTRTARGDDRPGGTTRPSATTSSRSARPAAGRGPGRTASRPRRPSSCSRGRRR